MMIIITTPYPFVAIRYIDEKIDAIRTSKGVIIFNYQYVFHILSEWQKRCSFAFDSIRINFITEFDLSHSFSLARSVCSFRFCSRSRFVIYDLEKYGHLPLFLTRTFPTNDLLSNCLL